MWKDGEEVQRQTRCEGADLDGGALVRHDRYDDPPHWRGLTRVDGEALPRQPRRPTRRALSPDGRRIAVGGDELVVVWDVTTRRPVGRIEAQAQSGAAWSADGNAVLTLGAAKLVWWAP